MVSVRVDGLMVVGVLAAGVALYVYSQKNKIADAAGAVVDAVNPASPENLAYRGVNGIGAALTGEESFTLGGWIYDVTHPNEGLF